MTLYNHRNRLELDQLVAEYTQKGMGRRVFLQRAMAVGLTAGSASALLAACGSGPTTTNSVPTATSVDVLNV